MVTAEKTKEKVRKFILNRPGEYMRPNDIAKMFGTTVPTVKAQFHFVAATNGGHTDAVKNRGMAYIPMKEETTVEEAMQKSVDNAVKVFSKRDPDQDKLNAAIAEAILSGDCKQHPKERIDISTSEGWTINEAAEYFGVSHEAVRTRIKRGELRSYKVVNGDRVEYRIKPEAIEEFEKNHKFRKYSPRTKKEEPVMKKNTKEDVAAEALGLPSKAACDRLTELERENLVLRTKVEIYERFLFAFHDSSNGMILGKGETDGIL